MVRKTNKRLRSEAIKLVTDNILARSGDSLYDSPDAKKLKTKIKKETAKGIKIPSLLLKRSTPQGS
jgi:hypothetical protein